jgi:hypothetical protein
MANELSSKDQLNQLLPKLSSLVKKLPTTLPCGTKDGPFAKYLTNLEHDKDSPYETFNVAWERVFQRSDNEKRLLITRGKYGLDLAYTYVAHFLKVPGIEENDGLGLMALRIEALIKLIEDGM